MASVRGHPYLDTRKRGNHHHKSSSVVCKFWLTGRCNRDPCYFAHQSLPASQQPPSSTSCGRGGRITRNRNATSTTQQVATKKIDSRTPTASYHKSTIDTQGEANIKIAQRFDKDRVCAHWMSGTCIHAEKCQFLHSWVSSKAKTDIERVAQRKEHKKAVTGIALPSGSHILYTGSRDGTLRAWDAHTGNCIDFINVGAEVGCMISQSSWIFVGVQNSIWAWNTAEPSLRLTLEGPAGQVRALVVCHDILFAACEDGHILAYKPCPEEMTFRQTATLKGHSKAVLSLAAADNQIYSGSADRTIRCWNPDTFQCTHILEGHSGSVTSLIAWECFLLSGSLDKTIKVWAGTQDGGIEEFHTSYEEQGVNAFMGMTDAEKKSVLFVCCNDNSVRLHHLGNTNGLADRGRLFSEKQVTAIAFRGREIYTGDASGNLDVWKWLAEPCT